MSSITQNVYTSSTSDTTESAASTLPTSARPTHFDIPNWPRGNLDAEHPLRHESRADDTQRLLNPSLGVFNHMGGEVPTLPPSAVPAPEAAVTAMFLQLEHRGQHSESVSGV